MSCSLCEERTDLKCTVCNEKCCIFHCAIREHHFAKNITCDRCRKVLQSTEISQDLLGVVDIRNEELERILKENQELQNGIMELEALEEAKERELEDLENITREVIGNLGVRLVLEERSKNNAKNTYENIYCAIETQQNRIDKILNELSEVKGEMENVKMVIEHKMYENQEISKEISQTNYEARNSVDLAGLERILCDKCRIKIFNLDKVSVANWAMKSSDKGCASCLAF